MKERLVIYQVLPRLFGASSKNCVPNGSKSTNGCGRMADFTKKALAEIHSMGVNCIWYTGMLSHASKTDYATYGIPSSNPELVKGNAGSPYAVKDYYDVNPDLATNISKRMDEFTNLVRRTHDEGMKFIMDFIPNHVAAEYVGTINPFTDENYYPGHLHDGDWTDTAKLNYSCHSTWEKMLAILLFWAEKGVDGFRCDMAELVPCIFWQWAIPQVKARHKGIIFIAEVYNPWEYRNYLFNGHFDYLYDKVGLYDTLKDVVRGQSASLITQCWQNVDDIRHHMVNFLENHDEQRLASQWFASDPIKGRPALLVSALMGTNPFMLYFGQELGEAASDAEGFSGLDGRTSIFDYWTIDSVSRWANKGRFDGKRLTEAEKSLKAYYSKVLGLINKEKAIREGSFFDIMYANYENMDLDTNKVYAFLRHKDNDLILVTANFSGEEQNAKVVIPKHAFDCLNLNSQTETSATELLTSARYRYPLLPDEPIQITIPAFGGTVLKFSTKQ